MLKPQTPGYKAECELHVRTVYSGFPSHARILIDHKESWCLVTRVCLLLEAREEERTYTSWPILIVILILLCVEWVVALVMSGVWVCECVMGVKVMLGCALDSHLWYRIYLENWPFILFLSFLLFYLFVNWLEVNEGIWNDRVRRR